MPDMIPVVSSNIEAVGFDDELEELTVEFKGGRLYSYDGVKRNVYDDLIKAPSVGSYFAANIRGFYNYTKLK